MGPERWQMMRQRKKRQRSGVPTLMRHLIATSDGPDIEFDGECLLSENYVCVGEVKIYRTRAGTIVASQQIADARTGHPRTRATTLRAIPELSSWLGHSAGVKEMLEQLGHPSRHWVD